MPTKVEDAWELIIQSVIDIIPSDSENAMLRVDIMRQSEIKKLSNDTKNYLAYVLFQIIPQRPEVKQVMKFAKRNSKTEQPHYYKCCIDDKDEERRRHLREMRWRTYYSNDTDAVKRIAELEALIAELEAHMAKLEKENKEMKKLTVLSMTNENIIKEFNKWHHKDDPLCFEDFDFDGWRKYMFDRGNIEPDEAIDASYENHAEFHEDNDVWRINWEGEVGACDFDNWESSCDEDEQRRED